MPAGVKKISKDWIVKICLVAMTALIVGFLGFGAVSLIDTTMNPPAATLVKASGEKHNLEICKDLKAAKDESSRRILHC